MTPTSSYISTVRNVLFFIIFLAWTHLATSSALAAVTFDSSSSQQGESASINWSHTVSNTSDRLLLVGLSIKDTATANSVVYDGTELIRIGSINSPASRNRVEIWYLRAPNIGTADIDVNLSTSAKIIAGAISFYGVDQAFPVGTFSSNSGASNSASTTVASSSGDIVFATVSVEGQAPTTTSGAGQIEYWNLSSGSGGSDLIGSGSTEPGGGAVSMTWSHASSRDWAIGAVAVRAKPVFPGTKGTVLFPTRATPPSSDTSELARINFIESLDYAVQQVYSRANTATYNAAIAQSDVVYISERVNTAEVSANLKSGCTGVVSEELNLVDEFGIVSNSPQNSWYYNDTRVFIRRPLLDGSDHYILQDFPAATSGFYDIFGPELSQGLQFLDNNPLPTSYDQLAFYPADLSLPTLVAIEAGDLLADGTIAAGRRVVLPWMQSASSADDFNAITVDGANILNRSLEWALADSECSFMQKRSFLPDGTPLADGAQVGTGTEVKFLIYINNKGSALSDINVQDILDPTFVYKTDTLQIDNTLAACALNTCTAAEESAIFAAVDDNPVLTDPATTGDGASFDGANTINVGSSTGNASVNVNANSVWALLFSVTMN